MLLLIPRAGVSLAILILFSTTEYGSPTTATMTRDTGYFTSSTGVLTNFSATVLLLCVFTYIYFDSKIPDFLDCPETSSGPDAALHSSSLRGSPSSFSTAIHTSSSRSLPLSLSTPFRQLHDTRQAPSGESPPTTERVARN